MSAAVSSQRTRVLQSLANRILALPSNSVLRVAIDGVDGAGKTTFGDELGRVLESSGRNIIRVSVDGFHNPREQRYRLGKDSPEGFFVDSYDYSGLREALLEPLSPGGSRRYRLPRTLDARKLASPSWTQIQSLNSGRRWDLK